MQQHTLSEFNELIKSALKDNLAPSYWIVAEIGEMSVNQKGHCYLELVEKKDNYIVAKNRATIWAYTFTKLNDWFADRAGTPLKNGMKVLVNASLQYHEVFGLSINIKDIDPNFTIGERERKKQETIKQLEREGIIDMNKSIDLPLVPQNIAVISSETAAGYGDFIHQIENNPYNYKINTTLFNAIMQGDAAPKSIVTALCEVYENEDQFDLLILIRGGGAQTDMDCFDDFNLCMHLAQFPLPIITGIGHERDHTIADLVANTKMKTPTAVAEFIIVGMSNYEADINQTYEQIAVLSNHLLQTEKEKINELKFSLKLNAQKQLQEADYNLNKWLEVLNRKPQNILEKEANRLSLFEKTVSASDPASILKKGYSITTINGKAVAKSKPQKGDKVKTTTQNHSFTSTVN